MQYIEKIDIVKSHIILNFDINSLQLLSKHR